MSDKPAYPEADDFWPKHDKPPYTGGDTQGAKLPPIPDAGRQPMRDD
jgi:hypothetical protein